MLTIVVITLIIVSLFTITSKNEGVGYSKSHDVLLLGLLLGLVIHLLMVSDLI